MNKTAIVIATVMTTIILLSAAGIVYGLRVANSASADGAETGATVLPDDREAAYQSQIEAANQRLQEAQATQQALEAEINALQGTMQDPGGAGWMFGEDEHAEGGYGEYDEYEDYEDEHEEGEHHEGVHSESGFFGEHEDD